MVVGSVINTKSRMEIVVGSYEELILGYNVKLEQEKCVFEQSFTDTSHTGCIKSLRISAKGVLASGSTDETIHLFNLSSRKELGALIHHNGTITSLQFFGRNHMFSTSEDGSIGVWKTGKWECIRTLKGHKGPVYDVSIHPSGKMALSVGKDKSLRTWNLLTGKAAFVTNLKIVADLVRWNHDGTKYAVVSGRSLDLYNIETAAIYHKFSCDFTINAAVFLTESSIAVGGEGGKIQIFDIGKCESILEHDTETNRVKGLACKCLHKEDGRYCLATASSDGFLKIWALDIPGISISLLGEVNTKFRLTCVDIKQENTLPKKKEKEILKENSDSEDVDGTESWDVAGNTQEESEVDEADEVEAESDSENEIESDKEETKKTKQKTNSQKKKNLKRKSDITNKKEKKRKPEKKQKSGLKKK